jgi:hypothetical protein
MESRSPSLLPHADAQHYRTDRGEARVWTPRGGLVVTQVTGQLSIGAATAVASAVRRIAMSGVRVTNVHDWEGMTDYEPQARVILTEAGRDLQKQIEMNHILLGSRIVTLAVQAASLVIPNIKVHPSRATFEATLRRSMT